MIPRTRIFLQVLAVAIAAVAVYGIVARQNDLWLFGNQVVQETLTPSPAPSSGWVERVVYRNEQYGFEIPLPDSWRGFTTTNQKEDVYDITGTITANNGVVDTVLIILVQHPLSTAAHSRQDIPIMVFPVDLWQKIEKEQVSVGAAPIPPSVLGRNSNYVIALPARYNYAFQEGWEEVEQIVKTVRVFEPASVDISTWKTYRNEKYGFEFKYPSEWKLQEKAYSEHEIIGIDPTRVQYLDGVEVPPGLISIYTSMNQNGYKEFYDHIDLPVIKIGFENKIGAKMLDELYTTNQPNPWYQHKHLVSYYIGGESHENQRTFDVEIRYASEPSDEHLAKFQRIISTLRIAK